MFYTEAERTFFSGSSLVSRSGDSEYSDIFLPQAFDPGSELTRQMHFSLPTGICRLDTMGIYRDLQTAEYTHL